MNKGLFLAVIGFLAVGLATPAFAAFEDVDVSPRSRAMGGAFAAQTGDAYGPFQNPASMAWADMVQVAGSYVRPFGLDFSNQTAGVGLLPVSPKWGTVGLGLRSFGVDYKGENLTDEFTFTLAHGVKILEDLQSDLAVGWSMNVYSLDFGRSVTGIDPGNASAVGLNFAAQATVRERTRVGFYAQNINNPDIGEVDKEELRRRVGIGVSYKPYRGVETVLDIANELGEDVQFRGGTEFEVTNFLWVRAGLRTSPNIFTAGLGIEHRNVSVNYAFSTGGGILDETHQFGVGYAFPLGK